MLKLAFNNDRATYDRVLRDRPRRGARSACGRASGQRHHGPAATSDGAPFDADGPGTSDLDLTLVGAEVLRYYSAFWIPGIHSKPLSDDDPDIAPELTPLRRQLMDMVHRPVNIQGTRDWIQHFRGDIMNQPYLTLFGSVQEP